MIAHRARPDAASFSEAHRLGGSTDQVARFKLGQGLAEAAPYFLLLSATPHQGKTDAFHRLLSLLDKETFADIGSVSRERVQPFIIRTEKRRAIDAEGKALFRARRTSLIPVAWEARQREQQLLYEAQLQDRVGLDKEGLDDLEEAVELGSGDPACEEIQQLQRCLGALDRTDGDNRGIVDPGELAELPLDDFVGFSGELPDDYPVRCLLAMPGTEQVEACQDIGLRQPEPLQAANRAVGGAATAIDTPGASGCECETPGIALLDSDLDQRVAEGIDARARQLQLQPVAVSSAISGCQIYPSCASNGRIAGPGGRKHAGSCVGFRAVGLSVLVNDIVSGPEEAFILPILRLCSRSGA